MSRTRGELVRETLSTRDVSDMWEAAYRTPENERFYDRAFDRVLQLVDAEERTIVLDVGCGPGFHALRLARRGHRVHAVDFSEPVLELARKNVKEAKLEDRVTFGQEDVTALSFADESYQLILCWGVLMHVPEVERAVDELARVLAPGGAIVVSERNLHSLETRALRILRWLAGRTNSVSRVPAGIEKWKQTSSGPLLTRTADVPWLVDAFRARGLELTSRLPGQFTEVYTKLRTRRLVALVHRANELWFDRPGDPRLASANILLLRKPTLRGDT